MICAFVSQKDRERVLEGMSDSGDDTRSWHCGCPCDPYPDDMFQGYGPPDPEFEEEADLKKLDATKKHLCKRPKASKAVKKEKKGRKRKEKVKVKILPEDLDTSEEAT